MLKKLLRKFIIIACIMMCGLAMLSYFSPEAPVLGVSNGQLSECPDSPNCVSSMTTKDGHAMEPITIPPNTSQPPDDADGSMIKGPLQNLKDVIAENFPRAALIEQQGDYLRYEFRTLIFRFVDDVEFLLDEQQNVIHFRSASRVGRSDLGQNRKRVDAIRKLMAK